MKKIVIIGAGVAGRDVLREIKNEPGLGLEVVGFIDDDPLKIRKPVNGSTVIGSKKDLRTVVKRKKIDEVIIAIPSASGEAISEYVKICSNLKVVFRIVPRVKEIIEGKAHVDTLKKPQVEDILGRPVVKADVEGLKNFFKGEKVLITGAAGSIGSELSRQVAAYGPNKLVLIDWWENGIFELTSQIDKGFPGLNERCIIANIQDKAKIRKIFLDEKPDFVFHAAAYKHVPLMEEFPEEAVKNNIFGTLNMIVESFKAGVKKFVLVSTDKAANPKSVMGATKLVTETLGKYYNNRGRTKFMAVRFGNVLDSYGSVVPIFRKQIEQGGPVTITDKRMTRYFMTIPEAAQLILKAASMGKGGELFVLDMGEPARIVDLAEILIRLSGLTPGRDIKIVYTGIRKGEKLREVLFTKKEKDKLVKTQDEKIFLTENFGVNARTLLTSLRGLKEASTRGESEKIKKLLHELVQNFS